MASTQHKNKEQWGSGPTQYKNGTTTPPTPLPLRLLWDNISNAPVADPSSVSDWNTFFDLPANGTPFTSVVVAGNEVDLYGGADIILPSFNGNGDLISIIDDALCVIEVPIYCLQQLALLTTITLNACVIFGDTACSENPALINVSTNASDTYGPGCFQNCANLMSIISPVKHIGDDCFNGCSVLNTITIGSCLTLGSTVGDNSVFLGVSTGASATLTIPTALMTCNAGSPDGDIQYLQAQTTLTIIQV